MNSIVDSIKAMPTIAMLLLCGCGAHKPYRVAWISMNTGVSGHGDCLNLNKQQMQTIARFADGQYPEIRHWVERCKQLIVTAPAVWVDAARESDQQLNAEFAAGHWSCPTGYQFMGERWEMGQRVIKRKMANGQQVEVRPNCWRHR